MNDHLLLVHIMCSMVLRYLMTSHTLGVDNAGDCNHAESMVLQVHFQSLESFLCNSTAFLNDVVGASVYNNGFGPQYSGILLHVIHCAADINTTSFVHQLGGGLASYVIGVNILRNDCLQNRCRCFRLVDAPRASSLFPLLSPCFLIWWCFHLAFIT